MIKLLVVDQQPIICKGLDYFFKTSNEIKVELSTDIPENIPILIKKNSVDIILSEIRFSNKNSIPVIKQLLKTNPSLKILFFSSHSEDVYATSAIKIGAKGFISKFEELSVLKKAIIEVYNNKIYVSPKINTLLKLKNNSSNINFKTLSNRETEVLKLLTLGKRNKEISELLNINAKTVGTYKMRVMKKLNANNLIDLVTQAKSIGL